MRAHLLFWFALALLANANGLLRVAFLEPHLDERTAHQLSTLSLIGIVTIATLLFARRVPFPSAAHARAVGVSWLLMTLAFEFLFGHFVAGHSYQRLLLDYDLRAGRVWPMFLVWLTVLPSTLHRLRRSTPDTRAPRTS